MRPINLSIGEPKHATPQFIREALNANLSGLSSYPATGGSETLRAAIAAWIERRYRLPRIDPAKQVLPVNGSREALFAFAQAVVDTSRERPVVVAPNPFYQIYEGAALLAGAEPQFLNILPHNGFALDFGQLTESVWSRTQLVYVCSPGNPTGSVMNLEEWRTLFDLSDRHGFVIASDECYSEIYFDEGQAPLGGLEAAHRLGRGHFPRLVDIRQPVEALQRAGHALGVRRRRCGHPDEIPALPHLPRLCDESGGAGCQRGGVAGRGTRARQPAPVPGEIPDNGRRCSAEVTDVVMPQAAFYLWLCTPIDRH